MINPSFEETYMINLPPLCEGDFRKSSYSDPDRDCVHVARQGAWVAVRDSKTIFDTADDRRLVLTAEQFDAFLALYRR
jgi:hypothetical protein